MAKIYENYSIEHKNEPKAQINSSVAKARFLELYMLTGHIQKTCNILGLVGRTIYYWKNADKQFAEDFIMAERVALSLLEDEATRRAMYGVEKPVYQGGKFVGYVTEYSDQLLIVLLKARDPSKYRDQWKGELTGADGKPLISDMKIVHVHSNLPLAQTEEEVIANEGSANTIRIDTGQFEEAQMAAEEKANLERDLQEEADNEPDLDDII